MILAISPTIDGETTSYYLYKLLDKEGVRVSQISRGISFGGELEYADELTLGRSIQSRLPYSVGGKVMQYVSQFLSKLKIEFHPGKTRVVHAKDGFDFL